MKFFINIQVLLDMVAMGAIVNIYIIVFIIFIIMESTCRTSQQPIWRREHVVHACSSFQLCIFKGPYRRWK